MRVARPTDGQVKKRAGQAPDPTSPIGAHWVSLGRVGDVVEVRQGERIARFPVAEWNKAFERAESVHGGFRFTDRKAGVTVRCSFRLVDGQTRFFTDVGLATPEELTGEALVFVGG